MAGISHLSKLRDKLDQSIFWYSIAELIHTTPWSKDDSVMITNTSDWVCLCASACCSAGWTGPLDGCVVVCLSVHLDHLSLQLRDSFFDVVLCCPLTLTWALKGLQQVSSSHDSSGPPDRRASSERWTAGSAFLSACREQRWPLHRLSEMQMAPHQRFSLLSKTTWPVCLPDWSSQQEPAEFTSPGLHWIQDGYNSTCTDRASEHRNTKSLNGYTVNKTVFI